VPTTGRIMEVAAASGDRVPGRLPQASATRLLVRVDQPGHPHFARADRGLTKPYRALRRSFSPARPAKRISLVQAEQLFSAKRSP